MKSFRELSVIGRIFAAIHMFRMTYKVVFGRKPWLFAIATAALFAAFFAINMRTDEVLTMRHVFAWLIWLPSTITSVFFAMGLVSHERNAGMIETLFTSSPSRYRIWIIKFAVMMSVLTVYAGLIVTATSYAIYDIPLLLTWFYLMPPVLFLSALTVYFSVRLKSGNAAGLAMAALLVLMLMLGSGGTSRAPIFPFFNPLDKPDYITSFIWGRRVVVNKILFLVLAGVAFWRALRCLDRRERLLN